MLRVTSAHQVVCNEAPLLSKVAGVTTSYSITTLPQASEDSSFLTFFSASKTTASDQHLLKHAMADFAKAQGLGFQCCSAAPKIRGTDSEP